MMNFEPLNRNGSEIHHSSFRIQHGCPVSILLPAPSPGQSVDAAAALQYAQEGRQMVETRPRMTEEEFMALPDDGRKYELVDGEAKQVPTGGTHGWLEAQLIGCMIPVANQFGRMFGASTGFRMVSGNIRCPDVSFMRYERLPEGEAPEWFVDGAPDLCVEIISASEDKRDSRRKVGEYFDSGAVQVWHVFPERRSVTVFTSLEDAREFAEGDTLEAEAVLPGLRLRVAELFETGRPGAGR
jgi:Uma2 family endonuclease